MVLIQIQKERQVRINTELAKKPQTCYLYSFKNRCKEIWLLSVQDLQNCIYVSFHSWTSQNWLILPSYG